MNKIEMIEKRTANILEQMNSDKTKHWGKHNFKSSYRFNIDKFLWGI